MLFEVVIENGKQNAKLISLIGVNPKPRDKPSLGSKLVSLLFTLIIGFAIYSFVVKPRLFPAYENMGFICEGKTHCSQMTSCNEAKYYLANCPNVLIDGDHDGEPCERQFCNNSW